MAEEGEFRAAGRIRVAMVEVVTGVVPVVIKTDLV